MGQFSSCVQLQAAFPWPQTDRWRNDWFQFPSGGGLFAGRLDIFQFRVGLSVLVESPDQPQGNARNYTSSKALGPSMGEPPGPYSQRQPSRRSFISKGTTPNALIMEELRDLLRLSARHNFHITALHIEGLRNTVTDAISCLHQPQLLSRSYTALLDYLPHSFVNNMPLCNHMSVESCRFVFSRCAGPPARYAAALGSSWLSGGTFCRID